MKTFTLEEVISFGFFLYEQGYVCGYHDSHMHKKPYPDPNLYCRTVVHALDANGILEAKEVSDFINKTFDGDMLKLDAFFQNLTENTKEELAFTELHMSDENRKVCDEIFGVSSKKPEVN